MKRLSRQQMWSAVVSILLLGGLYAQLFVYQSALFGTVVFAFFLAVVGSWWTDMIESSWFGHRSAMVGRVYGWVAAFFLLGFVQSVFVVWYKVTPATMLASFCIAAVVSFVLHYVYAGKYPASHGRYDADHIYFTGKSSLVLAFLVLWVIGVWYLIASPSSEALYSPWQSLDPFVLSIFFLLASLSGLFIVSKLKSSLVLGTVVLFSFFVHMYVPASHTLPWGGDVWRVIAVEERLAAEEAVLPVLFGEGRIDRQVFGLAIPEAFLIPHKYTYGQLWGTTVLLHKTMGVSLIVLNKWLVPLVWSLFVPLCLYRIGLLLFSSRRKGLQLAWLSSLIFTLQATGAFTLPVSFGVLVFLFLYSLLLESLQKKRRHIGLIVCFALLLPFGYVLHALLFWFALFAGWAISYLPERAADEMISMRIKKILTWVALIGGMLFVPAIEMLTRYSSLAGSDLFRSAKQLVGQFSGWFYASMIRPHDIVSGNILFNHTPAASFVSTIFTAWRYHVLVVSIAVWILACFGLVSVLRKKTGKTAITLTTILFAAVWGGYGIGWYVLQGDRLFTRRLDALLGIFAIIFALHGGTYLMRTVSAQLQYPTRIKRIGVAACIALLAWFGTTAWASGPDMRVASVQEYSVAQHIWSLETHNAAHCVLADTWVLLPLESMSHGAIVGGGLPIDYQFGQQERVELMKEIELRPASSTLARIASVSTSDTCWIVLAKTATNEDVRETVSNEFGAEPAEVGDFLAWQIDLKKSGQ